MFGRVKDLNVKENHVALWFLFFVCVLMAPISAPAQAAPSPTPSEPQRSEEDLVHFGDVVDVDFVGGFEYDWRGTITPDGNLDGLDAIDGPIAALCRDEAQIAADVARVYGKILRDPKVIVRIIDRSNRAVVRLEGAIKTPARFKLQRRVRLRELLVVGGGFTDDASGEIVIFRPGNLSCRLPGTNGAITPSRDNGSQSMTIKISDLLRGDPKADVQILSGDAIDVSRSTPVYVIGAVNSPKPVYVRSETTVTRAVASAGGLAKDADGGKVTISSRTGAETTLVETDLSKIKRGESVDVVLKPFDIIDVASKGGWKRKAPPVSANADKIARDKHELPLRVIE